MTQRTHTLFFSRDPFDDTLTQRPSHHAHANLQCSICRALVHPRAVCITRTPKNECSIPHSVRCPDCWGVDIFDEPATLEAPNP